jgi:hypothetical protein
MVHGFLVLRTLAGDTLADGDLIQVARDGSGDQSAGFTLSVFSALLVDQAISLKTPSVNWSMSLHIEGSSCRRIEYSTSLI